MHPPTPVSTTPDPGSDLSQHSENAPKAASSTAGFHLFSYVLGALTATLFLGGSLFLMRQPDPPPITLHPPPTSAPTVTPLPTDTPAPMTVYVSGAVKQPGLYLLSVGARVGDAIISAGGLTEEADAVIVNQAEKLWDGAQVHVPSVQQLAANEAGSVADTLLTSRMVEPPPGVSGIGAISASSSEGSSGGVGQGININVATAVELETLPGIGPSKAQAIIEHRPYSTVDELERVPGIGAKTVEQLRASVVVQ
jgi:competence protein ComEA